MSEFSIRTKTFRLGLEDYRALWLAQAVRPLRILFVLVLGVAFGIPVLTGNGSPRYLWMLAVYLVAAGGLTILALILLCRRLRRDPLASGERIIILESAAVRLIGYGFDTRWAWSAVDGISQDRGHLFIFTPGQDALIVPKRALASPDESRRLVKLARAAIRSSRRPLSALPPLVEPPDNRELWRSRPYRMVLQRPLQQALLKLLAIAVLLPCTSLLVLIVTSGGNIMRHLDYLVVIPILMVPYAGGLLVTLLILWLVFRRLPYRRGEREVCFTRDYVRSTGPLIDSRVDWVNVREVHQTSGMFLFRLANGWFHIPASAFASPAQATAFFTQAVAFWRAAEARR